MEVADLPVLARGLQLGFEPAELRRIERVRVEHEEPDVSACERVVAPAAHVQGRIVDAGGLIMIANGSLEPDARIEQRFVREFELLTRSAGL